MLVQDWGNYPVIDTLVETPADEAAASRCVATGASAIGRGLGRCYGDSALNNTRILSSDRLDHMIDFDPETGVLIAEAGVSLAEIVEVFAPRGWFVPVTPGTKFVTLGGAVASDVHGKNHHVSGTFGQHVLFIEIITPEKGLVRCSPEENADLFHATCGGHGLTGLITQVAVRLVHIPSVWIRQRGVKAGNLAEIMEAFETYAHYTFSVAWIDCLKSGSSMGRSFLMCGEFATPDELPDKQRAEPFAVPTVRPLSVPFHFPGGALNALSVKAFNALYYGKAPAGVSDSIVTYNTFFYPLDAIHHWNRIYGKRGFTQYQCVIPKEAATEGLPCILRRISESGLGSFLAVLKLFGKQECFTGNISFPTEGYTLALDFPISPRLFPVLDEMDRMVLDYGGRHYLTKDVRLAPETLRKGYGKALDAFLEIKNRWDPQQQFCSLQSQRLGLTK